MNKNLKVVSSLALAGILATTGLAGLSKVSAAEVDPSTNSLGKYATLGGVEDVVPYILKSGDKVTVKDLKKEFETISFNNNVLSDDAVIGTGTKFKSKGVTYTVLVYGDTNGDGLVDSDDAFDMLSHYVGNKTLKGIYLEAANVEDTRKNEVDSDDAYRTKSFYVGNKSTSRDRAPEKVETQAKKYTLAIDEGTGINNQNYDELKMTVTPTDKFENGTLTLSLEKLNEDEEFDAVPLTEAFVKETSGANLNKIEVADNYTDAKVVLDFSVLTGTLEANNGTYRIRLTSDTDDVVVAETEVTTHMLNANSAKVAANVFAKRLGHSDALIGLIGYGENDVTLKNIYCYLGGDSESLTADNIVEANHVVAIKNNEVTTPTRFTGNGYEVTDNDTKTDTTVYYALEDSYGNILYNASTYKVDLPANNGKGAMAEIVSIVPNEAKDKFVITTDKEFTGNVVAVLYKNNVAIASQDVTFTSEDEAEANFASEMTEVATYTVKAYVEGSDEYQPSTVIPSSNSVSVTKLPAVDVKSIAYNPETGEVTWNYSRDDVNFTITPETGVTLDTRTNLKERKAKVTAIAAANKVYELSIVPTLAEPDSTVLAGDAAKKEIFKLNLADATVANVNKDSFELTVPYIGTNMKENQINCKVEVRTEIITTQPNGDKVTTDKVVTTQDVKLVKVENEDGSYKYDKIVISELPSGTEYTVNVSLNSNGIESNVVTKTVTTTAEEVPIDFDVDTTLVDDDTLEEKGKGKIYIDVTDPDNKVALIDGKAVDLDLYHGDYAAILENVISKLAKGDHVKVNGKNITITTSENDESTEFGTITGYNITVIGNDRGYRTIDGTKSTDEETTLTLSNGKFRLEDQLAGKVVLNNVRLDSSETVAYTLAANVENTINGIKVKSSKEINNVSIANLTEYTVPEGDANLTFSKESGNLTINIDGDVGTPDHTGNITVTSKSGNVTIASAASRVTETSKITVTVENGTLTMNGVKLEATKNVTVVNKENETTTVVARVAPIGEKGISDGSDAAIAVKKYSTEAELTELAGYGYTTEEEITAVNEFMATLSDFANKATVLVDEDGEMTLTVTGVVNTNVPGLVK